MRKGLNLLLSFVLYGFLIGFTIYLFIYYIRYTWVLLLIVTILTILTATTIFLTNRLIDVKLSWIMVVVCLPVLGIFLYWLFGRPYKFRKKQKVHLNLFKYFYGQEDWNFTKEVLSNKENSRFSEDDLLVFNYTTKISFRPIYKNTEIKILANGPDNYYSIINDIKKAKKYIFMNYYIILDGELLEEILAILAKKITQGIKVYIIYDHVGSYFLSQETIIRIKKMGINFHKFSPIKLPFILGSYNFRNHRKDIIIDGVVGYAGGINLADSYIHLSGRGFWRDTQVRLVGDGVKSLELIFRQDWHFITGKILNVETNDVPNKIKNDIIVQLIDDGPLTKETIQKDLFIKYISMAKKRVWITTPYLFPTRDLVTALRNSAYSGVDVRLSLPGILDKPLLFNVARTYYDSLLEVGVKIYEFCHVLNHSKMGIFDDKFTIIGSTNLDYRSLHSDHQTLVSIYDSQTNEDLAKLFMKDFKYSNLIKENPLLNYSKFYRRIFLFLLRVLAPLF